MDFNAVAADAGDQKAVQQLAKLDELTASARTLRAQRTAAASARSSEQLANQNAQQTAESTIRQARSTAQQRIALAQKQRQLALEGSVRGAAAQHEPPSFIERQKMMAEALTPPPHSWGFHLGWPGAIGTAIGAAAHSPGVGLGAAGAASLALQPWFLTRAGLALTGEGAQFATRQAPRFAMPFFVPPDNTSTGGQR